MFTLAVICPHTTSPPEGAMPLWPDEWLTPDKPLVKTVELPLNSICENILSASRPVPEPNGYIPCAWVLL